MTGGLGAGSPQSDGDEYIVLSPDLSGNATGRSLVFVDLLQGLGHVTLAGWSKGPLWGPLKSMGDVDLLPIANRLVPAPEIRTRLRAATVIATKPLARSYGWALLSHARSLILDIDDPEIALATADLRTFGRVALGLNSPAWTAALLALRGRAAQITVASAILGTRYGGTVIPHARDPKWFSEESRDRVGARKELGLSLSSPLVVFVGTVRAHKGIGVLIEAARLIPGATFAIVGAGRPLAVPPNVKLVPPVAYADAVRWLAAADVVVVPQRRTRVGLSQSPAKLVDALAVGRAIVASDLPPIRELAGPAARLVEPDSPRSLADGVAQLLDDPAARLELELLARRRFDEQLSTDAVRPVLVNVLKGLRDGR